jgi:hypothetical protein
MSNADKIKKITKRLDALCYADYYLRLKDDLSEERSRELPVLEEMMVELINELKGFEKKVNNQFCYMLPVNTYLAKYDHWTNKGPNYCIPDASVDVPDMDWFGGGDENWATIYIKVDDFYFIRTRIKRGSTQEEINRLATDIFNKL